MSEPREALIVGSAPTAGGAAFYAALIHAAAFVIAADGGLDVCLAAGRIPDVCVGDFDSVSGEALLHAETAGALVRRYPSVKDESDLDLAVAVARELDLVRLTFTAAFALRLDHTLASLGTLLRTADLHGVAREPGWDAYAVAHGARPEVSLAERPGTLVSIMAVGAPAVVSARGLRYPLDHLQLEVLSSRGLSNLADAASQEVSLHSGAALVLVTHPDELLPLSCGM